MDKSINFLSARFAKAAKQKRIDFIINTASLVLLLLYGSLLLGIFIYHSTLKNKGQVLQAEVKNLKTQIENYSEAETKQTYLKNKVGSLRQIIDKQRENQKITEAIFLLVPEGIELTGFNISEEGIVNFSANSAKFTYLKEFINSLNTNRNFGNLTLSKVEIGSVNFNNKGGYSLSLTLYFNFG